MTSRGGDTLKTLKKPEDRLDVFPAFMKVAGRRVLVVGHGGEATAKVRLLGETNARIVVVSKIVEPDLQEAIDLFETEHLAEDFQPGHLKDAALVFSAREDWDLDKAVVDAARAQGVPVNAVDKPELCDFYTGALVNRAPIAVAITSTGVGPVLSRHIRARIEAMLPRSTGELARLAESLVADDNDNGHGGVPCEVRLPWEQEAVGEDRASFLSCSDGTFRIIVRCLDRHSRGSRCGGQGHAQGRRGERCGFAGAR